MVGLFLTENLPIIDTIVNISIEKYIKYYAIISISIKQIIQKSKTLYML